jgi:hypothetical protein
MKPIQVVRTPRTSDELKTTEIELAVSIACRSALLTIDHLGKVISRNATGNTLEDLKLHRRKCTKILTNVVGPSA